jgi:hypothetical protein
MMVGASKHCVTLLACKILYFEATAQDVPTIAVYFACDYHEMSFKNIQSLYQDVSLKVVSARNSHHLATCSGSRTVLSSSQISSINSMHFSPNIISTSRTKMDH